MEITFGQNLDQEHELLCLLRICSVEVVMVHPDGDFQGIHEFQRRGIIWKKKTATNKMKKNLRSHLSNSLISLSES